MSKLLDYDGLSYYHGKVQGEISQLQQEVTADISQLEAEVTDLEDTALYRTKQILSPNERETARANVGVQGAIYGNRRNYTKGVRISAGALLINSGLGVTDLIPCAKDDIVVWNFGGEGNSAYKIEVFDSNLNFVDYWSSNGYTNTRTITIDSVCAFLRATFYLVKSDGSVNSNPVSVNGNDFIINDKTDGYPEFVGDGKQEDALRWKPLPLGGLLNCDTNSTGQLVHNSTYDPIRVTTKSNICVPFPGCRLRFKMPDNLPYVLTGYLWIGTSNGSHSELTGFSFKDKAEVTLPSTALCIRPVFRAYTTNAHSYTQPITASDLETMIANGTLAIEFHDESSEDVVERNHATLINLSALRRVLDSGNWSKNGMDSMPVFAHITDLHGDAPRWDNFLDFCDKVGVDFSINSGDAVLYQKKDSSEYVPDFAKKHNTDVLFAIGNHESLPTGSATLFTDNISELATEYGYLSASGTPATDCYYYKDYDTKKVRVIVLNQYEDGVYQLRIGQEQVDWLVATLLSTPAGYGVIIVYHSPEDKIVAESPYDVFRQPVPNTGASYQPNGGYVDKRVVSMLVDAFIARESVNFTYDDHSATWNGNDDTTTQTVSVVADFSGVDATTEFICYVCGHRHEDWVGYYEHATEKQLCLCITCGNALYGDASNPEWSNQSDLPRGGVGVSQDAFCVYAIDRINGNVKVMRVGATVTQMMVKREMMVIPYKD